MVHVYQEEILLLIENEEHAAQKRQAAQVEGPQRFLSNPPAIFRFAELRRMLAKINYGEVERAVLFDDLRGFRSRGHEARSERFVPLYQIAKAGLQHVYVEGSL